MAKEYNISLIQGDNYSASVTVYGDDAETAFDYTDWEARMMIRRDYKAGEIVSLSLGDGLDFSEDDGKTFLNFALTHEQSSRLPTGQDLVYDIELSKNDFVTTIMRGTVNAIEQVTK